MSTRTIHTDKAPAAIGPYSQGIIANGLLFTAGQIALDPSTGEIVGGDVQAQTERVLQNLTAILDAAGASWGDVVKITKYLTDMRDMDGMVSVLVQYFGDWTPASTTVCVNQLSTPGARVELDMIAAYPKK